MRTAKEVENRLRRTLQPIMARRASSVHRREFRQLFDATAKQGFLREAGQRRGAVGRMYKWALAQDFVEDDPTCDGYSTGATRDRVLSDDEVRALWRWIDDDSLAEAVGDCLKPTFLRWPPVGRIDCAIPAATPSRNRRGREWMTSERVGTPPPAPRSAKSSVIKAHLSRKFERTHATRKPY